MAKKTPSTPAVLGYNERELASFVMGGPELVSSNLQIVEDRMLDHRFDPKKASYERKAEQLRSLSKIRLSETGQAIMQSISRSDLEYDDLMDSLRKLDIDLPLKKEEMYGARD